MTLTKKGYAVQVEYADGTRGLSYEAGQLPVIYANRKWAVERKHRCELYGMKARVVEVRYANPVVVEK